MTLHRITLAMGSPTPTPWRADTFFGHLCWGMAYTEGEEALRAFLRASRQPGSGGPPLVLSDGFPADLLPMPARLPPHRDLDGEQAFEANRAIKGRRWLTAAEFAAAAAGQPLDPSANDPAEPVWLHRATQVTYKNTIQRDTGTTGGQGAGGLHAHESTFWDTVTFYARLGDGFVEARLNGLLEYLAASGYGKEKSRGFGWVRKATLEPFTAPPTPKGANGFVALSTFVPAAEDPTDGWWRLLVKYGKVSEGFSHAEHPFKRPLTMLEAGAVFKTSTAPREWYGRMVDGAYPDMPEVAQYGYTLALPMVAE